VSHKTIIALTTAVALGCVPFATSGGPGGQYGGGYYGNGPVYDTCDGYNGCPGYGIPFVGGLINGALGGY
jgi:hypothetical protein